MRILVNQSYPVAIDSTSGNDTTGKRFGGLFLTLQGGLTAAQTGDTIYVRTGSYSPSSGFNGYKGGVSWHIGNSSTITFSGPSFVTLPESSGASIIIAGDGDIVCGKVLTTSSQICNAFIQFKNITNSAAAIVASTALSGSNIIVRANTFATSIVAGNMPYTTLFFKRYKASVALILGTSESDSTSMDISNSDNYLSQGIMSGVSTYGISSVGSVIINNADIQLLAASPTYSTLAGRGGNWRFNNCTLRAISTKNLYVNYTGSTVLYFSNCRWGNPMPSPGPTWSYDTGSQTVSADNKLALWNYTYVTTTLTTAQTHPYSTTDAVKVNSTVTIPAPLAENTIYYVRNLGSTSISLHPTATDATNDTNAISLSGGSGTHFIYGL